MSLPPRALSQTGAVDTTSRRFRRKHNHCACGAWKRWTAQQCRACWDRARLMAAAGRSRTRAPKRTARCACGRAKQPASQRCWPCYRVVLIARLTRLTRCAGPRPSNVHYRCTTCGKEIVTKGRCYGCATGKPVTPAHPPRQHRAPDAPRNPLDHPWRLDYWRPLAA